MGRGFVKHRPERSGDRATEAQIQAMNAKLAARLNQVKPLAQPSEASQSPKEKSAVKLEWETPNPEAMAIKTKCGRYSCCKVTLNGKTTYELWKLAGGGGWFNCLNRGLDNFLQARKLAEIDARKSV